MTPKPGIRTMLRRLGDREAWRNAGIEEFATAQHWLRLQGGGLALRLAVGVLALMMVPLAVGILFSSGRPTTPGAMIAFLVATSCGGLLGIWWLRRSRPSAHDAIWFVAIADICVLVGCLSMYGVTRVSSTSHLGMLAMLTAFLLGWRMLLVHCLFSLFVLITTTVVAVTVDGLSLGEVYPVLAPALAVIFALPMMVQFVVEAGRKGIGTVVTERYRDDLTGLYNRIGFQATLRILSSRRRVGGVVAVIDLDGFKGYNDTHGHLAGDQRLTEVSRKIREALPNTLIARMGGDEFLVAALRPTRAESYLLIRDLSRLVSEDQPGPTIGASAGAIVTDRIVGDDLTRLVIEADRALYEAKADRSLRIVIRDHTSGTGATGAEDLAGGSREPGGEPPGPGT
ncbi:GGDEF domain-containing protein [Tsukamurella asaccharolytica]|uniref:GGDEF domain-containing protein n=1 Tax=Tsukamurella asaccharolytica TaxID=2592067 RepID=A0A5C5RBS7_9ACTN|nr:GGDEF domain-containing protein [Tsukamurella asaccharolytica]TWS19974.1 GGDEF domain-containing protein [Tsukamurella asaccharolytica]